MTDRFLDCGDIFKVSHERQGTSEMEENHHSTGLQFLIMLQQPGLERDILLCFYACQVRLQLKCNHFHSPCYHILHTQTKNLDARGTRR